MTSSLRVPLISTRPLPPGGVGTHALWDFYECAPTRLNDVEAIRSLMEEAAVACGATIVESHAHQFEPYGVSSVIVLAESHLAIHTWPEHDFSAVDLFTCSDRLKPTLAFEVLKKGLEAKRVEQKVLRRGEG